MNAQTSLLKKSSFKGWEVLLWIALRSEEHTSELQSQR